MGEERPKCARGHLMKPNPSPAPNRPALVHYWPQDIAEHWDEDAGMFDDLSSTAPTPGASR